MFKRSKSFFILAVVAFVASSALAQLRYPDTRQVDHKDVYHGQEVADPYRWLETDVRDSSEVAAWVEAQNAITSRYLASLPGRDAIRRRLTDAWDFEKRTTPAKTGGRVYYKRNDGLQNQYAVWVQDSATAEPRVLIDPNTWSADGTVALTDFQPSDDGRHVAYGVAEAGSDWVTWRVMDLATGTLLPDEIRWVKFSGVAWTKDGAGFFYARYPEPSKSETFQSLNKNHKVYYHRVGKPQTEDVLVFQRPDQPEWGFGVDVTKDGRYLVLSVWKGTDPRNQIIVRDLAEPYAMPFTVFDGFENEYSVVGNDGPLFYFKTDVDAPRRRLIAADIRHPERANWKEIIPQSKSSLDDVTWVGGRFIAQYLTDAHSEAKVYAPTGEFVRDVDLGGIGTAWGFAGRPDDSETWFTFSSYTQPDTHFRYDVVTGERTLVFRPAVKVPTEGFEVRQVFFASKDGTRVPMFVAHRKGLRLDGANPVLLYGYGGFNSSVTPRFSVARLIWMQMGGVLAVANLRGGGEYGEEWHRAGTRLQKQNVFDDFIAAAEWLVANRYTTPKRLAIQGASNGGLLVGAVMTQRPDLFGAALPDVGVMDMLRFHRFTAGRFWVDDYGSADDPAEFKALLAYSPYHNVRKGVDYPPTLVTTADHDDRVVPGHSFKFVSALQAAHAGKDPVLIRIETRAGHGAGKPTTKQIEMVTDQWAFLAANLGMKLPRRF